MNNVLARSLFGIGACLLLGLIGLGYQIASAALEVKSLERTVTVKGLSEREVPADVAIWPITFRVADDDLIALYTSIRSKNASVLGFLDRYGFSEAEISVSPPAVVDLLAQQYASTTRSDYRYTAGSTITVYSENVAGVRKAMAHLINLGQQGVAVTGETHGSRTQFVFTGLNGLKPGMVEEATKNARAVARKFAADSESKLGKIKRASQGQFSIADRDSTTPHIKKVRVVSTVEYFLVD